MVGSVGVGVHGWVFVLCLSLVFSKVGKGPFEFCFG